MLRAVDVEARAVSLLRVKLDGVHVSTRIPNPRRDRMVRITLTDTQRRDIALQVARLTVECWGPDSVSAFDLAVDAEAALHAAQQGMWFSVETDGLRAFDDTESGQSRYLFNTEIITRVIQTP